MQSTPTSTPGVWEWQSGDWDNLVRFTPNEAEPPGELTWVEDLDPYNDEHGDGAHMEASQTLADFLHQGPHLDPPVEIIEAMLAHFGAPKPTWMDPYRLRKAAFSRNWAEVQEMLAQGVNADMPVRGVTAFYCAITSQELTMAEALFRAGVDINRRFTDMNETILMTLAGWAPDVTWEPLAQRIVARGAALEAQNRRGETPLIIAARAARRLPGLVKMLLEAGAKVNARSDYGYTALWLAVSYSDAPLEVVQQLIAAGADVNASDKEGVTVLMEAISTGKIDSIPGLLAANADVHAITTPNHPSQSPQSVMQFALELQNLEVIEQIRKAGAEV